MELGDVTFLGPRIDDRAILDRLPKGLQSLLSSVNGYIQFGGGLHVRGACLAPDWHSLRRAWSGANSISVLFPAVDPEWVPFAEDCVGDQFLMAGDQIIRLEAETGTIEHMGLALRAFLEAANENPVEFLSMYPLLQYRQERDELASGHLLHAYPPFCTKEASSGVSLRAVPAWELHAFHAEFAKQLPPDGGLIRFIVAD